MKIYSIIIYIILGFILNIILTKLEKEKEDNFYHYIIISNIYILILSGIFKHHSTNIFLVVLFQTIGNIIYITYIKERSFLINNIYTLTKYILNIITTYLLNILYINKVDNIFLDLEQVKLLIWIFIIIYLSSNFKTNIKVLKKEKIKYLYYQDKEYIVMNYAKLKNKYYKDIKTNTKEIIKLVYAIMIYENYHKPRLIRKIDKYKYQLFHKENKFGIMQIKSNKYLDDLTSINLSVNKLEKIYNKNPNINKVIKTYYKKDNQEVLSIYKEIIEFDQK